MRVARVTALAAACVLAGCHRGEPKSATSSGMPPGDSAIVRARSDSLAGAVASAVAAGDTAAFHAATDREVQRVDSALGGGTINADLRPDSVDAMLHRAAGSDSATSAAPGSASVAPPSAAGIPVTRGMTITSALHFPEGDRENLVALSEVSAEGVSYTWHLAEKTKDGKTVTRTFTRFVSANDLASAPRLNDVFATQEREETPGYTAMSISRASFAKVMRDGQIPYTVTMLEGGGPTLPMMDLLAAMRLSWRGTLTRVSTKPETMPILLDGKRTQVPAVRLHGKFAFQEKSIEGDYWVLADSSDPLLLRETWGPQVLQVIRIDRPAAAGGVAALEGGLTRDCRIELPGIYFAFASADLDPASRPELAALATLLANHPDWSLAIEGHTDSVGSAASNQSLSERRAQAVRDALVTQFNVNASRLTAAGFGATRPRETNATIEGRARNRRVEAVRACGDKH